MGKKIKPDAATCWNCCYHMPFGSDNGKGMRSTYVSTNVACNYLEIEGKSRMFENGKQRLKTGYCNKYKPGRTKTRAWTSDNMTTEWRQEELNRFCDECPLNTILCDDRRDDEDSDCPWQE